MNVASLVNIPSVALDGEVSVLSGESWRDFEHTRALLDAALEIHAGVEAARESALQASREEGFKAGFQAGLEKLNVAVSAAEAERQRYVSQHRDTLLEIAFSLLARVLPELDREQMAGPLLKNALDDLGHLDDITVRLAPAAVAPLREALGEADPLVSAGRLRVIADPALSGSASIVETADGVIRLGFGRQLLVMEQALMAQQDQDD